MSGHRTPFPEKENKLKISRMADPLPLAQDTRWLITTGMAASGLALSIYNQWTQYRLRTPKVRVLLLDGIAKKRKVAYGLDEDPYYGSEQLLTITIKNYGHVDMTFEKNCCELEVKGVDNGILALKPRHFEPDLPATIKHGQNIKMVVRGAGLLGPLNRLPNASGKKVRVVAKDAIGRRFYGDWRALSLVVDEDDEEE
jgi:hypothetical protein